MSELHIHQPDALAKPARQILPDQDKLEALAEFAAGAGHEINNPLATIIGRAQQLLKDEKDVQRRQMLLTIGAQAYRIRDMIGDAMLFGRPPRPELADVNLLDAVSRVIEKQADELHQAGCQVTVEIPAALTIRADATQLATVTSELIRNARQAAHEGGGKIGIRVEVETPFIRIEITDCGKGFTENEVLHAFDPFFSGRQAGRGLGFGLPKCWRIVDQHQGSIEIQSTSGGPTLVCVKWPISELPSPE